MSESTCNSEYLILSRGRWDPDRSAEEIQATIDRFYAWYERLVAEGKLKRGSRLTTDRRFVTPAGITDGPFTETKEVIGGYWFIVAGSLDEAAAIAAQSPCLSCGLFYEIRPLESVRGSAYRVTNETPSLDR